MKKILSAIVLLAFFASAILSTFADQTVTSWHGQAGSKEQRERLERRHEPRDNQSVVDGVYRRMPLGVWQNVNEGKPVPPGVWRNVYEGKPVPLGVWQNVYGKPVPPGFRNPPGVRGIYRNDDEHSDFSNLPFDPKVWKQYMEQLKQQIKDGKLKFNRKMFPAVDPNWVKQNLLNEQLDIKKLREDFKANNQKRQELLKKLEEIRDALKSLNTSDKELRKQLMQQIIGYRKAQNDHSLPVFVNGTDLEFDVPPIIRDGRTLLPIRAVSTALGADVKWDDKTKTVTITKAIYSAADPNTPIGQNTIVLKLESKQVVVNGVTKEIDVVPFIQGGRTLCPFRVIAEALNKDVNYDKDTEAVTVDDKD